MKTTKTIIHKYRKSRPNYWLNAMKRKSLRIPTGIFAGETLDISSLRLPGAFIGVFIVFALGIASCSSHHYFSINAEEITNPSIMYSDSTSLTNPF